MKVTVMLTKERLNYILEKRISQKIKHMDYYNFLPTFKSKDDLYWIDICNYTPVYSEMDKEAMLVHYTHNINSFLKLFNLYPTVIYHN